MARRGRRADTRLEGRPGRAGLEEDRPGGLLQRVLGKRQHRLAVLRQVRVGTRHLQDRRGDVSIPDERSGLGAGRDAGAADQQGHLRRWVIGDELALMQSVLPLHEALVRGEDQIGVAEGPVVLQIVDDLLDRVIDGEQSLEAVLVAGLDLRDQARAEAADLPDPGGLVRDVLLVEARVDRQGSRRECVLVFRRGRGGIVRGKELDLHIERVVGEVRQMVVDPVDREIAIDVRRVVIRGVGRIDAVLVEGEARIGGGRPDEAVELALRGRSRPSGERSPARRHIGGATNAGLPEAVRHLADVDRPVPVGLQPDG